LAQALQRRELLTDGLAGGVESVPLRQHALQADSVEGGHATVAAGGSGRDRRVARLHRRGAQAHRALVGAASAAGRLQVGEVLAQPLQHPLAGMGLGPGHPLQAELDAAQRGLGTAGDLAGQRLDEPGQLGVRRHGQQRQVRPVGDVERGDRRLPDHRLVQAEGRDRGDAAHPGTPQSDVQPVVDRLRGGPPGQHRQRPRWRLVQLLRALDHPDLKHGPVPASFADALQPGQGGALEDLVDRCHG